MIHFFVLFQMEINGREVKVFWKLCAFQMVFGWKSFPHNMEKWNTIIYDDVVVKFSESTFVFHTWSGWCGGIIRKEVRLDWSEILALLNLNKFVCITCEPRRWNTHDVSNLFRYILRLIWARNQFQRMCCIVSIDTRTHPHTYRRRVGSVSPLSTFADKINHLPNSWQNFHAHSIWFFKWFLMKRG